MFRGKIAKKTFLVLTLQRKRRENAIVGIGSK